MKSQIIQKSTTLKAVTALSLSALSLLWACNKNDTKNATPEEQTQKARNASGIPDSAFALLDKLVREETDRTPSERTGLEERTGDRASSGIVNVVGNRAFINGARIGELCPNNRTGGDLEFGGGPLISCRVTLYPSGNSLYAWVVFSAAETRADHSTVTMARWVRVSTIPGRSITAIRSGHSSWVTYRGGNAGMEVWPRFCNDGHIEEHWPAGGSLVRKFKIIGDTGGNDISWDSDCRCDTKIYSIELNPIEVTIRP